jgi:hypothetical protein
MYWLGDFIYIYIYKEGVKVVFLILCFNMDKLYEITTFSYFHSSSSSSSFSLKKHSNGVFKLSVR